MKLKNKTIITKSSQATFAAGKKFGQQLKAKDVVLFEGALGGGKTTFIQGVIKGLNAKCLVLSPTFTLVRQYPAKKFIVYHADLYRLNKVDDLFAIGLDDYIYAKNSLVLIEWGEKIEQFLPKYIKLVFSYLGLTKRKIKILVKDHDENK